MSETPSTGELEARLHAAVAAGVIDRAASERLLPYLSAGRDVVSADEEQLRLITGFNDIFVTIGLVLFLGALSYLMSGLGAGVAAATTALATWLLAEFFTRRKRMAFPSIVLLLAFTGSVLVAALVVFKGDKTGSISGWLDGNEPTLSLAAFVAAVAAGAHWLRFAVPITLAAAAAALVVMVLTIITWFSPDILTTYRLPVFLPIGLVVFAVAMWFDMSDLTRKTRRTDIAFWLHLLAAPIIVHPVILSLTVAGRSAPFDATTIIAVFLVLCLVALIVDRRAVLVSSLGYLAYATYTIVAAAGWSASASAVAGLAVGGIVLLLSAAWRPLRLIVIRMVPPSIRMRVPGAT